jgi:uncharacterized protein with von Willebrand factor type A (vWA) domain
MGPAGAAGHSGGGGRYRYGRWRGGPDPLAPPFDVRAAVDELGRRVLDGTSLGDAMREVLRQGAPGQRGLADLLRRARQHRDRLRRAGDLGGSLRRAEEALREAVALERATLALADDDAARFAETVLDTLPDDVGRAVSELAGYQWRSPDAEALFRQLLDQLRGELVGQQIAGLRELAQRPDPAAMQQVKDMLADLNALLAKHARGEATQADLEDFLDRHPDLFPDRPGSIDELVDELARRQVAAQRLMRSLSPADRDALAALSEQLLGDLDLRRELAQLQDTLRTLRPGLDRDSSAGVSGDQPLDLAAATGVVADLADAEAIVEQLSQAAGEGQVDDVDVAAVERQLGPEAAADLQAVQELEQALRDQGWVEPAHPGTGQPWRLSAKALRRLGEDALRAVFAQLSPGSRGDHDDPATGGLGEPAGSSRPWLFGDEHAFDSVATVRAAILRQAERTPERGLAPDHGHRPARPPSTGGRDHRGHATRGEPPVRLTVDDFAVVETEHRTSAAVALCVDLSFSMVNEGRWVPMKQTALALAHLVSTRFRGDHLQIIGFHRWAQPLTVRELAEVEPAWLQGTNLQHALVLARRHLAKHATAEPVVIVVTDGEPTASVTDGGEPVFTYPPSPATIRRTVAAADALAADGATLSMVLLGDDPRLARFVDGLVRRCGGRVLTPRADQLGQVVVRDYVRRRSGARR